MGGKSDIVVGVRIARAQILDLLRRNASTRREQALYTLIGLLLGLAGLVFVQQGYALGVATRDGVDAPVVAVARNMLVPGLLVLAVFGALGAAQSLARDSVRPLVLTSASTRAIVLGKVLYLFSTWAIPLGFGLLVAVSYSIGAGTPLFAVALVLAGLPALALTMILGLSLAYLLWLGIELLGLPEWARRLLTASISLIAFFAAFAVGMLSGQGTALGVGSLPTGDPATPLGWYADLLFVGSPMAEPIGMRTVVAAAVILAAIPLAFGGLVRLAPKYWYAAPATSEEGDTATGAPEFDRTPSESIGRTAATVGPSAWLARSRTLRATLGYVRNGVRRPDQYVYLFYYLFPVAAILLPVTLESPGNTPLALGGALVVLGVWFAGGVFCLNPLGVEGSMLSQLVLAETPADTFVHGRLLAGLLVGVPLAVVGAVLLAVFAPVMTAPLAVLGTALVLAVVVTSGAFALGIGSVLPKFETIEVFDSVETLAPSTIAAILHGALVLFLTVLGIAVAALVALPDSGLAPAERLATAGVFVLSLVALADGSRRYAIARSRDYGHPVARLDRPFAIYFVFGLGVLAFLVGQAIALGVVLLLGVDLPVAVLLPILFVLEYLGYALVAVGFLYVTHRGWSYLDLGWPSIRELGLVAAGVAGSLAIWAVGMLTITGLGLPAADHALFDPTEDADPSLLLVLVPLLLFVNGPIEELLYRNVVQKYLAERFSTGSAVAITSVVFALAHVPAYLTAGFGALAVTLGLLFAVSCLWGMLYAYTRSLFVVAATHGIYNAALVGMAYVTVT